MRKVIVCFDYPTASDDRFFRTVPHLEINRVALSVSIKFTALRFRTFHGKK